MYQSCLPETQNDRGWRGNESCGFFQRSCHESGDIAGYWLMVAALGSAEPASCHCPIDGDLEHRCSHHGNMA